MPDSGNLGRLQNQLSARSSQSRHGVLKKMMRALRYYWKLSRGYRLRPWRSPYLRWRMETFFGPEAEPAGPSRFFSLLWRERRRLREFMDWADAYRRHAR